MRPLFHFALGSGPALFLPGERHTSQGGESHETEPEGQVHSLFPCSTTAVTCTVKTRAAVGVYLKGTSRVLLLARV